MNITRHQYLDGYQTHGKPFGYPNAKLTQLDHNSNWPDLRFTMSTCEWPDYQDKPEGYQRFMMYGANMFLFYEDVFMLSGFVAEDTDEHQENMTFILEKWYCRILPDLDEEEETA